MPAKEWHIAAILCRRNVYLLTGVVWNAHNGVAAYAACSINISAISTLARQHGTLLLFIFFSYCSLLCQITILHLHMSLASCVLFVSLFPLCLCLCLLISFISCSLLHVIISAHNDSMLLFSYSSGASPLNSLICSSLSVLSLPYMYLFHNNNVYSSYHRLFFSLLLSVYM